MRSGSYVILLFALLASVIALPNFVSAQQTLGAINGTVTDASGAVLGAADVSVTNTGTGLRREARSSPGGSYAFQDLPIGTYSLSFTHDGFKQQDYPSIRVQADRTVTLNAQLQTGSVTSSVEVNATPLMNSTDTTNGYVLDSTQIESTPLATGSFTQLAILAPGVNGEFLNGTGTNEGLGNQPIWANGQRDTDNTFQVNGVDVSNLFNGKSTSQVASSRVVPNTGENFSGGNPGGIQTSTSVYDAIGNAIPSPNPESITELRVNTSMYDAQQGQTSGAHIDLSTASGTNQYHGQAYLYRQTDWLNAAPFFYKQNSAAYGGTIPLNQVVPQLHRFTAGATGGGPILRDKLFAFFSYNAIRVTDQLNGSSQLYLPSGLSDDRSAAGLLAAVSSVGGNPATPLDPAAVNLLQFKLPGGQYFIPSSNGSTSTSAPNAFLLGASSFKADQANGNLDYNLSKSDVLSGKYFFQHDPSTNPFTDSSVNGFQQHLDAGGHVAAITNSFTPNANLSWQQTFGFAREKAYSVNDQPLTAEQAGINLFGFSTFPGIYVSKSNGKRGSLKVGPTSDFFRDGVFQSRFAPSTSAIQTLGKHTVSYGASYAYTQLNIRNRRQNTGQISFLNFADFADGVVNTQGNNSQFLQGAANRYYRSTYAGAFLQDKWQLRPNLSVTAGIRYDYDGPLSEKYGNLFNFDSSRYSYNATTDTITNDGFVIAGNNKLYPTHGVSDSTLKERQWGISPRIGFAYSPTINQGKVVFRGGFGLYYNRGEYFTYLSPGAGGGLGGPFGVTQEPPFVIPFPSPQGATLSNPYGTVAPTPPTGNPADFANTLQNLTGLRNGNPTYPFGAYDLRNKLPYTENFTFDMQWQPLSDFALTIGYVGNRGRHGVIPVPFNQPSIATPNNPVNGETASYGYQATDTNGNVLTTEPDNTYDGGNTDLRVPYIGYGLNSVTYRALGNSAYDALQVHVEKRLSRGLQVGFSYTFSHSLDEQSGLGLFFNGSNPLNIRSAYGSSDFDRTNVATFNYRYQLPDLIHSRNLASRFTNGWALQGITVLQSGQPYSVEDYSGAVGSIYYSYNDGATNPIIPLAPGFSRSSALTGRSGAFLSGGAGSNPIVALNPAAFAYPFLNPGQSGVPACGVSTAGAPVCDVFETDFGGEGQRNIFRQSFQKRADISLVKNFAITERINAKYTFDVYNVTNTSSFDIPANSVGAGFGNGQVPYDPTLSLATNKASLYDLLGTSNSPNTDLNLGQVQNTIGSPRNIQMSLHIIF